MTQKEIVDLFKRFLIVFLVIVLPLIVVLTLVAKLASGWVIAISVVLGGLVFALEEYLHNKTIKKRQERREKYKKDNK